MTGKLNLCWFGEASQSNGISPSAVPLAQGGGGEALAFLWKTKQLTSYLEVLPQELL